MLLSLAACTSQPTGSVQFAASVQQALSSNDITRVKVTVSASDMPSRVVELAKSNASWGGLIGNLPAGSNRSFLAEAFDSSGTLRFQGQTAGVTITANQTIAVAITLQEVPPPPPYGNEAPVIDSLVASTTSVQTGASLSLTATVHDPNPGDTLTLAWTASGGTFSAPTAATTSWTAPASTGIQTLTLTVTDSQGAVVSVSLAVNVISGATTGNASLDISFNLWPVVSKVSASLNRLDAGQSTSVSANASDADGDALSYLWTATCPGTWTDATSSAASFVPSSVPAGVCNNCRLIVTVQDSRGGQTTGSLSLCVAASSTERFPPHFINFYQSATSTTPGQTVAFDVTAMDPQSSSLSFAWTANTGSLATAQNTASTSRVVWTAPSCTAPGETPTVTATVTNAFGLVSSTAFTLSVTASSCVQSSCKSWLVANPAASSGVYTVDPDGNGPIVPFKVFCDMTTAGGGWTVIEKSPYGNAVGSAFHHDVPVNESSPELSRHRVSKTRMVALKSISTDMRIDCRGKDYLVTAAGNLFSGQGGPSSCENSAGILYKEASLKGRVVTNKEICTWFMGTSEGCAGVWHIDEHAQAARCGLPNYPWSGTAITNFDSDTFATDPYTIDTSGHECHTAGAVRHTLLR
ncbi:fibrinogen-like YCDxxxxGGGW domain-containing protein [Archangium sp.]|uniref:fibrinogen-like YCDxxxxGGGW domain-containing protein n=1 Tax=Archangium sp. TaxID=1872627 RepID=UPI002D6E3434|nr:fibrinogen-like YCDxxxxGGGW domain-containing protein [Archangium sp.]HYO54621.1 fibrinogen-like YCDxxxxGGGW domain-containing protein [Archangium sp.]